MQVLLVLVDNAGNLVEKDTLFQLVWGRRPLTDDVLTVAVSALRKALGDRARDPRFIQTVPGRGYRLIATPDFRPVRIGTSKGKAWLASALFVALCTWWLRPASEAPRTDALALEVREARYLSTSKKPEDLLKARRLLEDALSRAPQKAAVHASLADCLVRLSQVDPDPAVLDLARRHARTALRLAPSALAFTALAYVEFALDLDVRRAERTLRSALAQDDRAARAHLQLGVLLTLIGRSKDGERHLQRYAELDVHAFAEPFLGLGHLARGNAEQSIRELERCVDATPNDLTPRIFLARAYAAAERATDCLRAYEDCYALLSVEPAVSEALRAAFARDGLCGIHAFVLTRLQQRRNRGGDVSQVDLAAQHALLGNIDTALDLLENGFAERRAELLFLRARREFDALHGQPRFEALLSTLGLSQPD